MKRRKGCDACESVLRPNSYDKLEAADVLELLELGAESPPPARQRHEGFGMAGTV
jgi:hypothetical protein